MSQPGTVHIVTADGTVTVDGVPYIDEAGQRLVVRAELDVVDTESVFPLAIVCDWWWEVDPDHLPEWARGQVEALGDKVHRR